MANDTLPPSGIIPINTNSTDLYPYILRCIVLSDHLTTKFNELNHRQGKDSDTTLNATQSKQVEKLLELLVKSLKKALSDPNRSLALKEYPRSSNSAFLDCLKPFGQFISTISSKDVGQKIGNIEALVMIFTKYAAIASAKDGTKLDNENVLKFATLIRFILKQEFYSHPGNQGLLMRLNACLSTKEQNSGSNSNNDKLLPLLREVFMMDLSEHQRLLNAYRSHCNEQSAFHDLKKCLTHLELMLIPYLKSDEYPNQQLYNSWKSQERTTLNQLLVTISVSNPDLISFSQEMATLSANEHQKKSFIFIPKEPRDGYRLVMLTLAQHDLGKLKYRVKTSGQYNVTETSQAILKECFLRWRITPNWKVLAHLEAVTLLYHEGQVDFEVLIDTIFHLQKHISTSPIDQWPRPDRVYLYRIFLYLTDSLLAKLAHHMQDLLKLPVPLGQAMVELLDYFFDSDSFNEFGQSRSNYLDMLDSTIQPILIQRYEALNEFAGPEAGESEALNLKLMAKLIMRDINHVSRIFIKPLLGKMDVVDTLINHELKYFTLQVENMANGRESELIPLEDAFDLYNSVLGLYDLAQNFSPALPTNPNMVHWFNRQFTKWLNALDSKALGWVELAIKYDKFVEVSESALHSSSVDDLVQCFREQLDFVARLLWPNDLLESRSMAKVAKVIYESVQLYADEMESLFEKDLAPAHEAKKGSAKPGWGLLGLGSQVGAVDDSFTKEMCIKINNIFHLRRRVQELFANLDYARYSRVLAEYQKQDDAFLIRMFYIKVVMAENLKECDNGKDNDAYVKLCMDGETLFTTSIQWDSALPKWNETVGISLDKIQDLNIEIYDKDLLSDDLAGEAKLSLDPNGDWSSEDQDIWLEVQPQGRILLSITTADEKDDPHYYVSKAIKLLEMKEKDLLHQILSRLTGTIKSNLSRPTLLKELNKRKKSALARLITKASPSESEFTEEDVDQALVPLANYLDSKLNLPYTYLYQQLGSRLVKSVWSECLRSIEASLIPSFSDHRQIAKPLDKPSLEFFIMVVELLKVYFHGGEDEDGLPLRLLESSQYQLVHSIQALYFNSVSTLIQSYLDSIKQSATSKNRSQPLQSTHLSSPFGSRLGTLSKDPRVGTTNGKPKIKTTDTYKSDVILRLIRMKGDKDGDRFVQSQLEVRRKQMEWVGKPKTSIKPEVKSN